jgi:hypothetical protein
MLKTKPIRSTWRFKFDLGNKFNRRNRQYRKWASDFVVYLMLKEAGSRARVRWAKTKYNRYFMSKIKLKHHWTDKHITSEYNEETKQIIYTGWDETGADSVFSSTNRKEVVQALVDYSDKLNYGNTSSV